MPLIEIYKPLWSLWWPHRGIFISSDRQYPEISTDIMLFDNVKSNSEISEDIISLPSKVNYYCRGEEKEEGRKKIFLRFLKTLYREYFKKNNPEISEDIM